LRIARSNPRHYCASSMMKTGLMMSADFEINSTTMPECRFGSLLKMAISSNAVWGRPNGASRYFQKSDPCCEEAFLLRGIACRFDVLKITAAPLVSHEPGRRRRRHPARRITGTEFRAFWSETSILLRRGFEPAVFA